RPFYRPEPDHHRSVSRASKARSAPQDRPHRIRRHPAGRSPGAGNHRHRTGSDSHRENRCRNAVPTPRRRSFTCATSCHPHATHSPRLGRDPSVIVVCGEALIDVIHNGDGTQRALPGGGPFSTARALARLGVPTSFLGHLSDDAFGRELAELLRSDGASLDLATFGPERTTLAMADVDSEGLAEYQFVVQDTSAPQLTLSMLPDSLSPEVNALHLGTLGMVLEPMASTLVEFI